MMQRKILDIFSSRERKRLLEKLQYLDKKIPLITLKEEQQKLAQEKREMRDRFYRNAPINELTASINDLISAVERHLSVQEDEDYARIIEHLTTKDIASETDIKEIRDPLDRQIVFQHVLLRKRDVFHTKLSTLREELVSFELMLGRTRSLVSEKKDAEELRSVWAYLLQDEQDRLNDLKQEIETISINEIGTLEREVAALNKRLTCLEKYVKDYLSEQALEVLANEVQDYMPREDVTCQEIYKGLGDSIVTELKDCTGGEIKEKMIKQTMAKLIYGRLKKGR